MAVSTAMPTSRHAGQFTAASTLTTTTSNDAVLLDLDREIHERQQVEDVPVRHRQILHDLVQ